MSQQDIYRVLQENKGKWLNSKEISEKLGLSLNTVINNLKKIRKTKEIDFQYRESTRRMINYAVFEQGTRTSGYFYRIKV